MSAESGRRAAVHNTRRVWAAVSANPRRTARQLAADLGLYYTTVYRALRELDAAGYIHWERRTTGQRDSRSVWTVEVPFIVRKGVK